MNSVMVEPLELESLTDIKAEEHAPNLTSDLSVVGHVRVRLTAHVGDVELPLAELFELKSGVVLGLDQHLDEPVMLALNGKMVATAHLVAVGDCFGVQIEKVL